MFRTIIIMLIVALSWSSFQYILNKKPKPLSLDNFKEIRDVGNDNWNKIPNGEIYLKYFSDNGKEIGYINYRISTGQICLFQLEEEYRNRGLGKQILGKVINDLKKLGIKEVWAITTENHEFWSNVYKKSFEYKKRPHKSVTGSGYSMKI